LPICIDKNHSGSLARRKLVFLLRISVLNERSHSLLWTLCFTKTRRVRPVFGPAEMVPPPSKHLFPLLSTRVAGSRRFPICPLKPTQSFRHFSLPPSGVIWSLKRFSLPSVFKLVKSPRTRLASFPYFLIFFPGFTRT